MKKSEAYEMAQIAIVSTPTISPENKIEIIRYLMNDAEFAKYCEKQEEKKNAETV